MHADTSSGPAFPSLPPGAAEELTAAVEAGSGRRCFNVWFDPLAPEQVRQALDAVLCTERPDRGLDVLSRCGLLEALLPEVHALVGFGEGIRHKDVWVHTRTVVRRAPPRLLLRWAALLHDIGKVPTRRFENGGQVTFIGHPEVGARMLRRIRKRLPFEDAELEHVRFLVAAHLRAAAYDATWTDSAVRRFARDAGACLEDLLDLARADITSKYEEKVRRGLRQIDLLAERIRVVTEADARVPPLPKGLGTALIERLGIAPGPGLGRLMRQLTDMVGSGELEAQAAPEHYLQRIASDRARFGLD
jgi:poly(A) polymerase